MNAFPFRAALRLVLAAAAVSAAAAPAPRLATLAIPGDPRFVAIARDVLEAQAEAAPDFAAQAGLVDDAMRVPSFAPAHVAALARRLHADLDALRALPWRQWSVDEQIDVRWVAANAERLERELVVERLYTHRPGAWLETIANDQIAILTYAGERTDALEAIARGIPGVVAEMDAACEPTRVDAEVATGLVDGIVAALRARPVPSGDAAVAALAGYRARLAAAKPARPFAVIGADNYAWRLQHAELLPWTPAQLRTLALARLGEVDLQRAALKPHLAASAPPAPEIERQAKALDQRALLGLYDDIQVRYRAAIERAGFVTIPPGVGPVRARVTPDAMIPLTGDGGSMNPPPPWVADDTGWWNVEHFQPAMPLAEREETVHDAVLAEQTDMGPYSAHEGLPGHHLQLAIARLNPDPLRKVFFDNVQNEGWALYAEQAMWENGGLGPTVDAHDQMLQSWRARIRRVVYDVGIETGEWTLQQGEDWKRDRHDAPLDPDVQRSVNWPAQLVGYFAGKEQILQLKADVRRKLGDAYSERRFHDELLALGSIPFVFARAKMLGEPVPGF